MAVIARDEFTYSAPPTSGAAEFTATDNTATFLYMDSNGSPVAADQVEFTQTFTGGTVTIRARWSTTGTLLLERISTIAGTSNGTATLATITGASTSKPRTDGDLVRIRITVNRGAVNALTAIGWGWAPRSSATETNSGTFNVDGELTPSAGAFTVSGTSFRNRPNIEGTTPDTIALGTWARVSKLSSNGQIDWLGTESDGQCRPQRIGSNEVVYALQSTGASGDYTVRATATYANGEFPGLLIAGRLSGSAGTLAGYVVYFGGPDSFEISEWSGGAFNASLLFDTVTAYDDGSPHLFEVVWADDVCTVIIDTITVGTVTGLTTLTGDPGVGGYRSSRTVAGVQIEDWEIDDSAVAPPAPPNPCIAEVARDDFLVAEADIHNQPLTSPSTARWEVHPASAGTIVVPPTIGVAIVTGAGRAVYLAKQTGVGPDYCVQPCPRFPAVPTIGTPGYGAWRYRILNESDTILEDGLVANILGTNTIHDMQITDLTAYTNGQPHTWNQKTVTTDPGGAFRTLQFYATAYLSSGGLHTWPWTMDFLVTIEPTLLGGSPQGFANIGGPYRINGQPLSGGDTYGFDPASVNFVPSPQNYASGITTPYPHPYPPFYYPQGNPGTQSRDRTSSGSTVSISLALGGQGGSGAVDIEMSELKVDGTTSIPTGGSAGTADGGGEFASAAALACYSDAADAGYRADLIFDHTGAPIVGTVKLECLEAGAPTLMREWNVGIAHNTEYTPVLRVQGTVLVVEHEGDVLGAFDVATDLADETSALVTDYTGAGFPGIALRDASETGEFMTVDRVVIYNGCTGGPENPYPHNDPPVDPVQTAPIWVRESGAWQPVLIPDARPIQAGIFISPQTIHVRDRGLWVEIPASRYDHLPDPITPGDLPPRFDPCQSLDPGNPADLPPVGDVTPTAFAGGRKFGFYNYTPTLFDARFNLAVMAGGNAGAMMTALAQALANGGGVIISQGSKSKFLVGGVWSRAAYFAWVDTYVPHLTYMLARVADGTLPWVQILDDWYVAGHFPSPNWPNGIMPDSEVEALAAYWASVMPGIPLAVRKRPRGFANPIAGVLIYVMQFGGPRQVGKQVGDALTSADYRAWRDAECARLASWGSTYVGPLHLNYLGSGADPAAPVGYDGGTTRQVTPTEILAAADGFYGDSGGGYAGRIVSASPWQFDPVFLARGGMMDAVITERNGLMNLPPL